MNTNTNTNTITNTITNVNINVNTGVPFGIISANSLHPDVVDVLLYGGQALNITMQEFERELRAQLELDGLDEAELEERVEEEFEFFHPEEPVIAGTRDGVEYSTSWLGGALHFFILDSPVVSYCRPCSPCVPNAGDLDSPGDYTCYGVPEDWLA